MTHCVHVMNGRKYCKKQNLNGNFLWAIKEVIIYVSDVIYNFFYFSNNP